MDAAFDPASFVRPWRELSPPVAPSRWPLMRVNARSQQARMVTWSDGASASPGGSGRGAGPETPPLGPTLAKGYGGHGLRPTVSTALSEQRQVVCVGRSTRRPKRRLGREGAPLGQRGGAPLFVDLAGDEMALLIEMVVDLGMN